MVVVSGLTLACAMAQASTALSLGAAAQFTILNDSGTYNETGNNVFSGANFVIGLGQNTSSVNDNAGSTPVTVDCYTGLSCSAFTNNGNTLNQNSATNTTLNNAVNAVWGSMGLYGALTSLPATATYSSAVTTSTTFNSSAGNYQTNVIALNGGLNLTSGSNQAITISGNATDTFIFLVSGGINTNQNNFIGMTLTGGVTASNIIWVDQTGNVVINGVNGSLGATWDGTIVSSTSSSITIDGTSNGPTLTVNGSLYAGDGIELESNPTVNANDEFVQATPEPSSLSFALIGCLLGGAELARRRKSR